MATLTVLLLVANLVVLLLVLRAVTLPGAGAPPPPAPPAAAPGTVDILRAVGRGQTKTFIDNIETIRPGAGPDDVRRVVGPPDRETVSEWVYYLDPHAGYRVRFNASNLVETVQPWVS